MESDFYSDSAYTADISTRMRVPDRYDYILLLKYACTLNVLLYTQVCGYLTGIIIYSSMRVPDRYYYILKYAGTLQVLYTQVCGYLTGIIYLSMLQKCLIKYCSLYTNYKRSYSV